MQLLQYDSPQHNAVKQVNEERNEKGFIMKWKDERRTEMHVPSEGEKRELRQQVVYFLCIFKPFILPHPKT